MPALTHPPADALAAFARGALPPDELSALAEHVGACPECCAALGEARDDSFVHMVRSAGTPDEQDGRTRHTDPGLPPPPLDPPDARTALADHPQYRLLDQLGEGGMGVVFRAEHRVMGRTVALKVMAPHLTARPAAVARFRQEVKAAARLNHQHIVTAHDAGEAGGLHFLVMEYVEGVSLDRLVARRGPLAVPLACQFVRQAALGLQHAYEKGMVHRDIKPQNLMVTRKGQVKVLDFGLARFAREPDAAGDEGAAPTAPAATAANVVMGTPDYLSPEQARCAAVDIRADVYSLGCTLYFLLTGRPPFDRANSVFEKLLAHATEAAPPLAATRLDVPGGLVDVLARMMAKDPDARYATPAEAAAALVPFARGESLGAAPAGELVAVPVVEAVPAFTPAPSPWVAAVAEAPTEVIAPPRPKPAREKKRKRARSAWTPGRWIALGGTVVGLLVAAAVGHQVWKRVNAPAAIAAAPTPPGDPTPKAPLKAKAPDAPARAADAGPWRGAPPTVLFVLPVKGLWPDDYHPVRARLEEKQVVVKVAVGQPLLPKGGFAPKEPLLSGYSHPAFKKGETSPPVKADLIFGRGFNLDDFRAVVFVGADVGEFVGPPNPADTWVPEPVRVTEEVIRRAQSQNLVIGGICTGQVVLAKHGVLTGRTVAESPNSLTSPWARVYTAAGSTREPVGVRTDGRVVTAAGPENAVEFADALAAALRE